MILPRATTCSPAPSTFTPVSDFSQVCSTRYCVGAPSKKLVWSGNTGGVTREEVESAIAYAWSTPAVSAADGIGDGNGLAYGPSGLASIGMNWLYQFTGDIRALDLIIQYADNVLALRNSNTTGEVIWTGRRELVWPTNTNSSSSAIYAGCEQGEIAAHIATAALWILQTPCVWSLIPPASASDFPTPFTSDTSYLSRAQTYLQATSETYETYLIPWFFDKNNLLRQPDDPRWTALPASTAADKAGTPMPWNRRMMILHGLIRLAQAYEDQGSSNAATVSDYDTRIAANIVNFLSTANKTTAATGEATFVWNYVLGTQDTEEAAKGIHGQFDMLGLFLAWQRNAALYGITDTAMATFANTFQYTVYRGSNSFSGFMNGTSDSNAPAANRMKSDFAFYGHWLPEWFETIATANSAARLGDEDYQLFWVKNAIAANSNSTWRSQFGSAAPPVPPSPPSANQLGLDVFLLILALGVIGGVVLFLRKRKNAADQKRDSDSGTDSDKSGSDTNSGSDSGSGSADEMSSDSDSEWRSDAKRRLHHSDGSTSDSDSDSDSDG